MTGLPTSENDWFAPAPPFKPIPVGAAAARSRAGERTEVAPTSPPSARVAASRP